MGICLTCFRTGVELSGSHVRFRDQGHRSAGTRLWLGFQRNGDSIRRTTPLLDGPPSAKCVVGPRKEKGFGRTAETRNPTRTSPLCVGSQRRKEG